jgi:hypothetical protein
MARIHDRVKRNSVRTTRRRESSSWWEGEEHVAINLRLVSSHQHGLRVSCIAARCKAFSALCSSFITNERCRARHVHALFEGMSSMPLTHGPDGANGQHATSGLENESLELLSRRRIWLRERLYEENTYPVQMTSHDLRGLDCVEGALNHVPSNSSLLFSGVVCELGGYRGKNHQTKARAYCLFTADGNG